MDWFLYDNGLRHERAKQNYSFQQQVCLSMLAAGSFKYVWLFSGQQALKG